MLKGFNSVNGFLVVAALSIVVAGYLGFLISGKESNLNADDEVSTRIAAKLKASSPALEFDKPVKSTINELYLVRLKDGSLIYASLNGDYIIAGEKIEDSGSAEGKSFHESLSEPPTPSKINGLFELPVADGSTFFTNAGGDWLIRGFPFSVSEKGIARIDNPRQRLARREKWQSIDPQQTINFIPPGGSLEVVYVFTDPECGYCKKLHGHMDTYLLDGIAYPGYLEMGIEIRYLAYPRQGITSGAAYKLAMAWCADDKQLVLDQLLTDAKPGDIKSRTDCSNPVADHYALGGDLQIKGTPTIFLRDGTVISGYVSPDALLERLKGLDK